MSKDEFGFSSLFLAAQEGHLQIIEVRGETPIAICSLRELGVFIPLKPTEELYEAIYQSMT